MCKGVVCWLQTNYTPIYGCLSTIIIPKLGLREVNNINIIDNLVKIMDEKGITAYQLEKDIGINQTTFYNWKQGRSPAVDKILKILEYLEVTPNRIFGYPDIKISDNDKELLELFNQLPEREQLKLIGRVEELVNKYKGE